MQAILKKECEKIKISIISSIGPPPYLGGIENVVDTVIKSSLRKKYEFCLFDTYRKPDPNRKITEKIHFGMMLVAGCFRHLLIERPEIVHIHFCSRVDFWKHSICLVVATIMGKKTLFHLHGGSFDAFYKSHHYFVKGVIKKIFLLPDIIVALSGYWKNFLSAIVGSKKIQIVPNPIDCIKFMKFVSETSVKPSKNIVLIGSLGRRKGHYDALKAMKVVLQRHPDAILYFAGIDEDPDATIALKDISRKYKIENNVHFLGPVSGDQKLRLFGEALVIILPSYGENMPISVLEGMAAGKPVISTNVGAVPEVIDDNKNGLLMEPGDWRSLSKLIVGLIDDPVMAKEMGSNASRRVYEKWDVGRVAENFNMLYQGLLIKNR